MPRRMTASGRARTFPLRKPWSNADKIFVQLESPRHDNQRSSRPRPLAATSPVRKVNDNARTVNQAFPRSMYQQRRIRWCPYPCGMTTRTTRTKRNDNRKEQKQTISCWFGSATVAPVCASCKFNLVSVCKIKIKASKEQLNHFLSSNHMSTILLF